MYCWLNIWTLFVAMSSLWFPVVFSSVKLVVVQDSKSSFLFVNAFCYPPKVLSFPLFLCHLLLLPFSFPAFLHFLSPTLFCLCVPLSSSAFFLPPQPFISCHFHVCRLLSLSFLSPAVCLPVASSLPPLLPAHSLYLLKHFHSFSNLLLPFTCCYCLSVSFSFSLFDSACFLPPCAAFPHTLIHTSVLLLPPDVNLSEIKKERKLNRISGKDSSLSEPNIGSDCSLLHLWSLKKMLRFSHTEVAYSCRFF